MMRHEITHRFHSTFKVSFSCQLCDRPMFYGVKCKDCKYLCHKNCAPRAPPSCGLPEEFVDMFAQTVSTTNSNKNYNDSSSGGGGGGNHNNSNNININSTGDNNHLTSNTSHNNIKHHHHLGNNHNNINLNNSGHNNSNHSYSLKDEDGRQNSISAQEWDIPYEEITVNEVIGNGKFNCDQVLKGYWHGDIAIKRLNIPDEILQDEKTLELVKRMFKEEVANFRNTRHDNLEIFMGTCIDIPKLAIITTYCKGDTLHEQIYHHKIRFSLNRIIHIAQQICLAMGYLHSRNIVHKDLKTKNVFFDNGQIVITDFGLFSLKRLCRIERKGDWLAIPKGWLSYLAPELMRKLSVYSGPDCSDLTFTFSTDVYAFGTIWYELLTADLPYKNSCPEITIWQVGRGLKQPLVNLQAPREIKNILLMCWSAERPNFQDLRNILELIPRKRVQRSSSFHIDGSRY